jgi:hypothetical protein
MRWMRILNMSVSKRVRTDESRNKFGILTLTSRLYIASLELCTVKSIMSSAREKLWNNRLFVLCSAFNEDSKCVYFVTSSLQRCHRWCLSVYEFFRVPVFTQTYYWPQNTARARPYPPIACTLAEISCPHYRCQSSSHWPDWPYCCDTLDRRTSVSQPIKTHGSFLTSRKCSHGTFATWKPTTDSLHGNLWSTHRWQQLTDS